MQISELITILNDTITENGDMEINGIVNGIVYDDIEINCPDKESPCYIELYHYPKFKIFIYKNSNTKSYIMEKSFKNPDEIKDVLKQYEGFWCCVIDLSTLETILEGAFDDDFLNKEYYQFKN